MKQVTRYLITSWHICLLISILMQELSRYNVNTTAVESDISNNIDQRLSICLIVEYSMIGLGLKRLHWCINEWWTSLASRTLGYFGQCHMEYSILSRMNNKIVSVSLLNSLRPNYPYMCPQTRPSSVQLKVCRLFGTKPLSGPVLVYF